MARVEERHRKAADAFVASRDFLPEVALHAMRAYAQAIADTEARIVAWYDAGCPGLDREQFVAFGPRGMLSALRDAIERGEWMLADSKDGR